MTKGHSGFYTLIALGRQSLLKGVWAMREMRVCKWCGQDFVARIHNQAYCCVECREKGQKANKRIYNRQHTKSAIKESTRKRKRTLWEINKAARENNMSYGKMVAFMMSHR
jgi:ribosomal protein L37AE/L43A